MAQLPKRIVENWVLMATGSFQVADVARELAVISPEAKNILRVYLNEFVRDGKLERVKGRDGIFRPIDNIVNEVILEGIDLKAKVSLRLPFGIEQYVEFYPKNTILVAGEPNAGKTAFLYNIAVMNCPFFEVDFYTNNESSPQEIVKRLSHFPEISIPPPFKIYERYDNFADVMKPGHVSIFDYLDMNSEFYLAGDEIEKIHKKTDLVSIIAMQLPPPTVTYFKGQPKIIHRKLAYGGGITEKKPVLYLDLWKNGKPNGGICAIEKAKNRAIPNTDPNNMQWEYTIDEWGAKFTNWNRHYGNNYGEDTNLPYKEE
jgi:hypothetical protein